MYVVKVVVAVCVIVTGLETGNYESSLQGPLQKSTLQLDNEETGRCVHGVIIMLGVRREKCDSKTVILVAR